MTGGKWSKEKRHAILAEVAGLPAEFGLPVVYGHLRKAEYREQAAVKHVLAADVVGKSEIVAARDKAHVIDVAEHMVAFTRAEIAVERQMHLYPRDEICIVITEDTDRVKKPLKEAHAFLRSPPKAIDLAEYADLPLTKVVDTPHFAAKAESLPLQVADLCAFLIMRRFSRREESQSLFEAIAPQLFWRAGDFGEPIGTEKMTGGQFY